MSGFVDSSDIAGDIRDNPAIVAVIEGGRPPLRFIRERFGDIEPNGAAWLVKNFMPAGGVGIAYGVSTVGKSFWALWLCLRVAMGKPVLGHKSTKSGVLYVAAEGQNGMRKRIKGLREKFELNTPCFQFIGATVNLLEERHVDALVEAAVEASAEIAAEADNPLGLIVIDTTAAAMPGGNENSSEDMGRVLAAGTRLALATNAMVLFLAHPGKNETLGVRGWSGQVGNVDALYYLTPSDEDDDLRVGVVQKLKDGPSGERFAYRLREFDMGVDGDGDRITSAYPVFEDAPVAASKKRKKPTEQKPGPALILRAMRLMIEAGQCEAVPPYPGVPPQAKAVRRQGLRAKAVAIGYAGEDEKPESIKRSINRDIQALIAEQKLRAEGELVWLTR